MQFYKKLVALTFLSDCLGLRVFGFGSLGLRGLELNPKPLGFVGVLAWGLGLGSKAIVRLNLRTCADYVGCGSKGLGWVYNLAYGS